MGRPDKITTREGQTQEALRVGQENPYRIRRDLACLPRNRRFEFISLQRRVHVSRDFGLPRREAGFSRGCVGPQVQRGQQRHGADRREYLCRVNFQYRGVDAAVA